MHTKETFAVRITVSEDSVGDDLVRAFQGWSQVTSFGRTQFGRRVLVKDVLSILAVIDSLGVEYDLSVPKRAQLSQAVSPPVIFGTPMPGLKPPAREDTAASPISNEVLHPQPAHVLSLTRRMLRLGWASSVFGLFMAMSFVATEMAGNRGTELARIDSIGVCKDDFRDNRYGWTVNSAMNIESGKYQITNLNSDKAVLVANGRFGGGDFIAEATVALPEGAKESFAGLAFHIRNGENFYLFGAALDGSFAVVKRELGFWHRLLPDGGVNDLPARSRQRTEHRLKVVVEGDRMEFYLDGELLTVAHDGSFEEGSFGFYVDKNLDAAFDDLVVERDWFESVESVAMR